MGTFEVFQLFPECPLNSIRPSVGGPPLRSVKSVVNMVSVIVAIRFRQGRVAYPTPKHPPQRELLTVLGGVNQKLLNDPNWDILS
ncbi:hypothetical protein DPMN_136586 [Dreissena polymorpha]|uniref:Uncharacterized protein n=1 Tax=Dreissena polymorpha TaxID=45954 RepID=A0A9D4JGV2_DREPO|nr:hypothetical protein DPMN_136586 [Dreissena polymorpha]